MEAVITEGMPIFDVLDKKLRKQFENWLIDLVDTADVAPSWEPPPELNDAVIFLKRRRSWSHQLAHLFGFVDWCLVTTIRDDHVVTFNECTWCCREKDFFSSGLVLEEFREKEK